ncbi:MAG: TonB-linked SusC/RagA family outer membrane protein, partial [Cyclobacteriaceae bacterium]
MKKLFILSIVAFLTSYELSAQQLLSGKVFSAADGATLSGVLISFPESTEKTTSGADGAYQIAIPEYGGQVVFTLVGYQIQRFNVMTEKVLDVSLQENATDQISIGFGSQSKEELTGSIAQIAGGDISSQPVQDLAQANQGRASGVFVQNNGGKLGQGTTVRIRGGSSLTGSNNPLYVVDGVPLTSDSQSEINPNNIASIEILKDASAAAIYGSRAANGVILITTKKGTSGKLKVDLDYQFGSSQTPRRLDVLSPEDYLAQFMEFGLRDGQNALQIIAGFNADARAQLDIFDAILADASHDNLKRWAQTGQFDLSNGTTYGYDDSSVLGLIEGRLDSNQYKTDWQDEIFRTALSHRMNINLSGGSENLSYFGGVGFTTQEGIIVGNEFDRVNIDLNVASNKDKKFSYQLGGNYVYSKNLLLNNDQDLGSPLQAILLPPSDAYDPANNYQLRVRSLEYNPLTEINYSDNLETINRLIGSAAFKYRLNDELSVNLDGGIDYFDSDRDRRQGPQTLEGNPTGFSRNSTTQSINYLTNLYANYRKDIAGQDLNITVGTSYQRSSTDFTFASARENDLNFGETAPGYLSNPIPSTGNAFLSYFGRVNYNIAGKYLIQASARADGSSKFGENNRFGYFPAVSAGWLLSKESFLSGSSVVSLLKLRGSYGIVGNTPDDDFIYRLNYFNVQYGNSVQGLRIANLANPDLKWESTAQLDVGLDFSLFADRVSGSLNYYQKNTSDLLFPVPVSQTSGFEFTLQNLGSMTNAGIEIELNTVNVSTGDFEWSSSFNITTNQNEVTDLGGRRLISGVNAFLENQPAGSYYLPVYLGINEITGEALYEGINGVPTANYDEALASGRRVAGNPNPELFGGVMNQLSYKNFDLSFNIIFVSGVDKYNQTGEFLANSGILNLNQRIDQLDRWYKPGDAASYPVLDPSQDNTFPSSRWIEDGSYVRLNNLMLAFNLPESLISNWGLGYFKFYVGGQNLLTLTNYSGFDADSNYIDPQGGAITANINRGIDDFTAPQPRVFTTGFKIG